jgi:hypothetical protein
MRISGLRRGVFFSRRSLCCYDATSRRRCARSLRCCFHEKRCASGRRSYEKLWWFLLVNINYLERAHDPVLLAKAIERIRLLIHPRRLK